MIEVRLHGRGGQGAVTAAELVAQAVIASDDYAQAFPNFGPERRGAPVTAFLRISDTPIYLRERIEVPDIVIVLDNTLLGMVDVTEGLKPGGTVIINATEAKETILQKFAERFRVVVVDADTIAMETLGVPITNTAIIGALVKATETLSLESLAKPLEKRFGTLAEKNKKAMESAFELARIIEAGPGAGETVVNKAASWAEYIRSEAMHPWKEVPIGCDVTRAGSAGDFVTGNWRTAGHPLMDKEKCISCGICWVVCPDIAFDAVDDGYEWNATYCKGCGICVQACPKKALSMEVE